MSSIQLQHAKLWFAGINQNWGLSEFEIGELKEIFTTSQRIETDGLEVKTIPMIYPPLDSLEVSIKSKNLSEFEQSNKLLTKTCNNCHADNNFGFNVITVPINPPVTNQEFKPKE